MEIHGPQWNYSPPPSIINVLVHNTGIGQTDDIVLSKHYTFIIIIRSRRQQRSVASTQIGHDDEPWTIRHEC